MFPVEVTLFPVGVTFPNFSADTLRVLAVPPRANAHGACACQRGVFRLVNAVLTDRTKKAALTGGKKETARYAPYQSQKRASLASA